MIKYKLIIRKEKISFEWFKIIFKPTINILQKGLEILELNEEDMPMI
jgi:hypothetical protein